MSPRRRASTFSFRFFAAATRARFFVLCPPVCLVLIFTVFAFAQANDQSGTSVVGSSARNVIAKISPDSPGIRDFSLRLSGTDIEETIKTYRTSDPAQSVGVFQSKMPALVTDAKTREGILQQLPKTVQKLKIKDSELAERFRKVIAPVLELYGREKIYDIIIIRHPTPVMFSDSGVVLIVSTGMIERAESDDELLGYVAHEVAHEYFAKYSIYSRYLLKLITEGGNETALKNKLAETLALIELQCDAFAALTLASLNDNPLAFIEGMERVGRDFPNHGVGFHPPDAIRRELIERVTPQRYLQIKSRVSGSLLDLKDSLKNSLKNDQTK